MPGPKGGGKGVMTGLSVCSETAWMHGPFNQKARR